MNTFDIHDKIELFEELESLEERAISEQEEFDLLSGFLESVKDQGGDELWRGSWYPLTFIDEDDFEDFAREEAEDLHGVSHTKIGDWPFNHIDWKGAAEALKADYSSVEYDGTTYLYFPR